MFVVGDRVKIIKNSYRDYSVGEIGRISWIDEDFETRFYVMIGDNEVVINTAISGDEVELMNRTGKLKKLKYKII